MIVKKREIPLKILKLEALLRRLPSHHPKFPQIQKTLNKEKRGYRGELAVEYPLSFLPEKEFRILHNVRLKVQQHTFQMDTIVLSPRYVMILEIKNFGGSLYFDDEFHQMIRNQKEAFSDPIIQVKRHKRLLKTWLDIQGFPQPSIFPLVIISDPSTLISSSSKQAAQIVTHRDFLPDKIHQFDPKYREHIYTEKDLKKVSRQLIKHHTPADYNVLDHFQISKSELITGVYCPVCNCKPLKREYAAWYCPQCKQSSRSAHQQAIQDYAYLWNTTITSKELQHFLHISSPALATRILKSTNFPSTGYTKSTVYDLKS